MKTPEENSPIDPKATNNLPQKPPNGSKSSDDPDSDKVEREENDDALLPDADGEDFTESYGDLEDGHNASIIPDPDQGPDNLQ